MEATFCTSVVNKMDQKGRVSVPAPFRAQLIAENPQTNIILFIPSFRFPMVEGSGLGRVTQLRRELDRYPELSEEHQSMQAFFGEMCQLAVDGEGRIMMPPALIEHANITESIAFVGAGNVFQMWEPSAYNEHKILMREYKLRRGLTFPAVAPGRAGDPAGMMAAPQGGVS